MNLKKLNSKKIKMFEYTECLYYKAEGNMQVPVGRNRKYLTHDKQDCYECYNTTKIDKNAFKLPPTFTSHSDNILYELRALESYLDFYLKFSWRIILQVKSVHVGCWMVQNVIWVRNGLSIRLNMSVKMIKRAISQVDLPKYLFKISFLTCCWIAMQSADVWYQVLGKCHQTDISLATGKSMTQLPCDVTRQTTLSTIISLVFKIIIWKVYEQFQLYIQTLCQRTHACHQLPST